MSSGPSGDRARPAAFAGSCRPHTGSATCQSWEMLIEREPFCNHRHHADDQLAGPKAAVCTRLPAGDTPRPAPAFPVPAHCPSVHLLARTTGNLQPPPFCRQMKRAPPRRGSPDRKVPGDCTPDNRSRTLHAHVRHRRTACHPVFLLRGLGDHRLGRQQQTGH